MVEPAKKIPSDEGQEAIPTERQILNMGPSHPATHGTVKFLVEFDGETIVGIDVAVGYLHRGFEKECESGTYYQAIPYTDRLNYASAILANLGYCMTVEKLLELELPRRCQWARVMAGELSRIGDHLTRIGAACLEVAAMTPFLYAVEAREIDWLADPVFDALCAEVLAQAGTLWGDGRDLRAILVTGGGALSLGERIQRRYPHARILDDAAMANVRGFEKYGLRKWPAGQGGRRP